MLRQSNHLMAGGGGGGFKCPRQRLLARAIAAAAAARAVRVVVEEVEEWKQGVLRPERKQVARKGVVSLDLRKAYEIR